MKIEENNLPSSSGNISRKVWFLPGVGPAEKICIFLDDEYYVDHMDAPSMLYEGGHEIRPWKEVLPKALAWLLTR